MAHFNAKVQLLKTTHTIFRSLFTKISLISTTLNSDNLFIHLQPYSYLFITHIQSNNNKLHHTFTLLLRLSKHTNFFPTSSYNESKEELHGQSELEWTPPVDSQLLTLVITLIRPFFILSMYMQQLPESDRPITGTQGAQKRRQRLFYQVTWLVCVKGWPVFSCLHMTVGLNKRALFKARKFVKSLKDLWNVPRKVLRQER